MVGGADSTEDLLQNPCGYAPFLGGCLERVEETSVSPGGSPVRSFSDQPKQYPIHFALTTRASPNSRTSLFFRR